MKRVSDKRRRENQTRLTLMESTFGPRYEWQCWFRKENWRVVAVVREGDVVRIPDCYGAVHGHELLKRSQGGSITDMRNIVLLCDGHNSWVEDNPMSAYRMGLVRHSWE